MSNTQHEKIVIVTGDAAMDWNLARTRRTKSDRLFWSAEDQTHACWQRGGCALTADLLAAIAGELGAGGMQYSIRQPAVPLHAHQVHPDDERYHHTFAIWSPMKSGNKSAWRVETFLGLTPAAGGAAQDWKKVVGDTAEPALLVVDDADLGFREHADWWPLVITQPSKQRPWILYKMCKPVASGSLWQQLHTHYSDQLIIVTTINDLRLSEVQISRELSWERTAQDLFWELVHNPCVNALMHCAHVVVSFGPAGAILLSREKETVRCFLFFDPKVIEGSWEQNYPGGMIGYTTCLMAGLARQLMRSPEKPDIHQGIQSGLSALRTLHIEGYGEKSAAAEPGTSVTFPIGLVTKTLAADTKPFSVAEVQDPLRFLKQTGPVIEKPGTDGLWTILQERYQGTLESVGERIVREGPEAVLLDVPLGQFGNLLTVDRQEIESFRSIRTLISEYCKQGQQKRPLSIAVFGAPGSGKSFGVTEVANSILPGQIEVREFNLSQFSSVDNLLGAFHQIRDVGLSGRIPLVFWDEFDSSFNEKALGWLRYFLSPMQDGRFQEGQISHPIGRSIFVFAGGTSASLEGFGKGTVPEDFRAAKGPDFVSRLKGYVNIFGPNPVKAANGKQVKDPYFIIRRAILLRSVLKRNAPQLFEKNRLNIDRGVLRALLNTREFKHGVRSIESIIAMSQLAGNTSFERSNLPAEAQLDLHVDGQDFLALVQHIQLENSVMERLAEAAHEIYRQGVKARGQETNASAVPFAELPEDLKEQNRGNVRDIPRKLAEAGYIMIPARSNEPPFNFPGDALEQLAESEHERWVEVKLGNGWKYGKKTNSALKTSQALLPWDKLSEEEKEKDRDLVRGIPKILARAGYTIVKTHPHVR